MVGEIDNEIFIILCILHYRRNELSELYITYIYTDTQVHTHTHSTRASAQDNTCTSGIKLHFEQLKDIPRYILHAYMVQCNSELYHYYTSIWNSSSPTVCHLYKRCCFYFLCFNVLIHSLNVGYIFILFCNHFACFFFILNFFFRRVFGWNLSL